MTEPSKVAVVGTGIMGSNHVRVIGQLPDVELVAVVDADLTRAKAAAVKSGAYASTSINDLPSDVEAAVIAVPTSLHLEMAVALVERGVSVLVEKPLAATVATRSGSSMPASSAGVVLAVGHVERFNPAVAELRALVTDPIHISASRISPYSPRISDGVVFDLMIHDIDIVCSLAGPDDEIISVSGIGRQVRTDTEDLASVAVTFKSGLTASFMTVGSGNRRSAAIEVTQPDSVVYADLVRSDVTIHRMAHHEYLGESGVSYRQSSVIEIPFIQNRGEPLVLEAENFVATVRSGRTPTRERSRCTARRGIATSIVESLRVSR